ncbi:MULTISPECIES: helix-turn-helix domain-containing protein [unclassified Streptomyces]|uniref:winged helix-turn-helix transcriptional regulator n=1 Tax=unclassified Streptomyces TaxID=2593676 RepID=UPI0022521AE4|nr:MULTISPECIES: helix-turn-helix domain-containing protein [unclassified Streptomyces]MCX5143900.1 helix-turn-helix transcriptional regulator [Streptomyces sp. NBC_00338]WRZ68315.1 helix-turn-helix transcriptional regulator [Streptomyces sp. NBC_01257]WSU62264.1 helix-turn-helix transcriptional regulator [Streptomyces sp. NBC_01104]
MAAMATARQSAKEGAADDAFVKDCPTGQLLARVSDKWVNLVVNALGEQSPMRYSDLGRKIPGVSQKMLTQTLRSLERDGIVTRTVTPSVPVRVDYELTGLGHSLCCLLAAVKNWASSHVDEVEGARERFDLAQEAL